MKGTGSTPGVFIGTLLALVAVCALSACGPSVTSGDENSVLIKSGPLTTFSDTEKFAQDYCAQFGKRADVQGSNPDPNTLQDTYRYDCVEDAQ